MFIFAVEKRLARLPSDIEEGEFGFFERSELPDLSMPALDRSILTDRILNGNEKSLDSIHAGLSSTGDPNSMQIEQSIG